MGKIRSPYKTVLVVRVIASDSSGALLHSVLAKQDYRLTRIHSSYENLSMKVSVKFERCLGFFSLFFFFFLHKASKAFIYFPSALWEKDFLFLRNCRWYKPKIGLLYV